MLAMTAASLCDQVEDVTGITTEGHALRYVNLGYDRFLSGLDPREESEANARHTWTFLMPLAELTISYQVDGTATGVYDASKYTVITATASKFEPSHVGDTIVVASTGSYTIVKWVSATVVWILGDNAFAGKTFTLPTSGIYDLPANFGGLVDKPVPVYSTTEERRRLQEVFPEDILRDWARENRLDTPGRFAITSKTFDSAVGQRYRIMFSPRADTIDRLVRYRYVVIPAALTDSTIVYPLGGAIHAHTILMAALAEFEARHTQGGFYESKYQRAFAASIDHDKGIIATRGPQAVGYDGPSAPGVNGGR